MEMLVPERYRRRHPSFRAGFFDNPYARPMGVGRDLYGRRKDDQEVAIEIGLNPLLTGEGAFVLASIIDITERKRAEEQIKASLLEKEVLLQEIHHRIKNTLQLLSSLRQLQSGYIHNPETLDLFRESENHIRSIAMIHEKLYQSKSLAKVDFAEYVNSLVTMLFHTFSNTSSTIALQTEIAPIFIDIMVQILIVEDEGIIAAGIEDRLKRLGYAVADGASTGEEALQAVAAKYPTLVLMDIMLKGEMDGIETARQLRLHYEAPSSS